MSLIHLLFPPGELGIPDHPWREAPLSARRVKAGESQVVRWNPDHAAKRRYTGYSHQSNSQWYPEHIAAWRTKHLLSKTQSRVSREPIVSRHRGHRVSFSLSCEPEARSRGSTPRSAGESTISPGTTNADLDSPSSPNDSVDTPSTPGSLCDRSRSGPFGHIFDGLRLTAHERDFLEELTQPDTAESPGQRAKRAPTKAEIVQTLSQMTYADFVNQSANPVPEPGLPSIVAERVPVSRSISVPVTVGDDDEREERDSDKSSIQGDIQGETEPPTIHHCRILGANAKASEKDQMPSPG